MAKGIFPSEFSHLSKKTFKAILGPIKVLLSTEVFGSNGPLGKFSVTCTLDPVNMAASGKIPLYISTDNIQLALYVATFVKELGFLATVIMAVFVWSEMAILTGVQYTNPFWPVLSQKSEFYHQIGHIKRINIQQTLVNKQLAIFRRILIYISIS